MSRVLDMWAGMTGTVLPFAGATAPAGWLLCAGQVVNRADYPNLFATIGTTYNTGGETSAQFRVPELRGEFIRGADGGRGVDAGRAVGTAQRGSVHAMDWYNYATFGDRMQGAADGPAAATGLGYDQPDAAQYPGAMWVAPTNTTALEQGTIANASATGEVAFGVTRPRNVALHHIIKH